MPLHATLETSSYAFLNSNSQQYKIGQKAISHYEFFFLKEKIRGKKHKILSVQKTGHSIRCKKKEMPLYLLLLKMEKTNR